MRVEVAALAAMAILGASAGVSVAQEPAAGIDPALVTSIAVGDVDKDEIADAVMIVEVGDEGDFDTYFYKSGIESPTGLTLHSVARKKLWGARQVAGQVPEATYAANGSFKIWSGNIGIGRGRWEQTLTIAYRDDVFVVAGYTYSSYDTLDETVGGSCDINILTGKGERNGKAIKLKPSTVAFADWDDSAAVKACDLD